MYFWVMCMSGQNKNKQKDRHSQHNTAHPSQQRSRVLWWACLSVCLSVVCVCLWSYLRNHKSKLHHGSFLLLQRCNIPCTPNFEIKIRQHKIRYRIFIVRLKADNNCIITEIIMTRNSKIKMKNLRSTGSRQEAVESVLRKEKTVYGGNDLWKR